MIREIRSEKNGEEPLTLIISAVVLKMLYYFSYLINLLFIFLTKSSLVISPKMQMLPSISFKMSETKNVNANIRS